jgi:hypothetical protein
LFIEHVSSDKISDLTTNLIRKPLIDYTQDQCALLDIPLKRQVPVGPTWDPESLSWRQNFYDLPVVNRLPVIFVPKIIVRRRMCIDSQEFYNKHILTFLQAEHLAANSGLVRLLKNGSRVVYKRDVRRLNPFSKDFLAQFVSGHPQVLERYKSLKGAQGALSARDFEEDFDESAFAKSLIAELRKVASGLSHADSYHSLMVGILEFLFYPKLTHPRKEVKLHGGRKRIDIVFTNWSQSGFWNSLKSDRATRARYVVVECKNYTEDIGNPEFDQLTGRFGHMRGFFGIICCRRANDEGVIIRRSNDAANDGRGIVLVLTDNDLAAMLKCVEDNRRSVIPVILEAKRREVLFGGK